MKTEIELKGNKILCFRTYDLYVNDTKVNPKKPVELKQGSTIYLKETNAILSKFWLLLFLVYFIVALGYCAPTIEEAQDKKNSERKVIPIKLKGAIANKIIITITPNRQEKKDDITVEGQEDFEIGEQYIEDCPLIRKRIKIYIIMMLTLVLSFLSFMVAILIYAVINK